MGWWFNGLLSLALHPIFLSLVPGREDPLLNPTHAPARLFPPGFYGLIYGLLLITLLSLSFTVVLLEEDIKPSIKNPEGKRQWWAGGGLRARRAERFFVFIVMSSLSVTCL